MKSTAARLRRLEADARAVSAEAARERGEPARAAILAKLAAMAERAGHHPVPADPARLADIRARLIRLQPAGARP